MKTSMFILICGIGIAGCSQKSETSQTPPPAGVSNADNVTPPATQPNNTAINARDNSPDAITAGMQGQGKSDIDVTAAIRRRIMDSKMSVDAQNAKVICQSGKVTLRGPVDNQTEKDEIGNLANDVAGQANVDNELEVKTNN